MGKLKDKTLPKKVIVDAKSTYLGTETGYGIHSTNGGTVIRTIRYVCFNNQGSANEYAVGAVCTLNPSGTPGPTGDRWSSVPATGNANLISVCKNFGKITNVHQIDMVITVTQ